MALRTPFIKEELAMGYLTYEVKVPQLMSHLQDRGLLVVRGKQKPPAQFLIITTGISPDKAYQAINPKKANDLSMDVLWKIWVGLRGAGITVAEDWEFKPAKYKERPITFEGDIYGVKEID